MTVRGRLVDGILLACVTSTSCASPVSCWDGDVPEVVWLMPERPGVAWTALGAESPLPCVRVDGGPIAETAGGRHRFGVPRFALFCCERPGESYAETWHAVYRATEEVVVDGVTWVRLEREVMHRYQ